MRKSSAYLKIFLPSNQCVILFEDQDFSKEKTCNHSKKANYESYCLMLKERQYVVVRRGERKNKSVVGFFLQLTYETKVNFFSINIYKV